MDFSPIVDAIDKAAEPSVLDYLMLGGLILTFLGLLVAAQQVRLARKMANAELKKRRRENAIQCLQQFQERAKPEFYGISRLLMHLSASDLEALKRGDAFKIPSTAKPLLFIQLASASPKKKITTGKDENDYYTLSAEEAAAVRFITVSNLNLVETVVTPAFCGVAEKGIVLQQMKPYFVGDMANRLKRTREAFGAEQLPNTFRAMKEFSPKGDPALEEVKV